MAASFNPQCNSVLEKTNIANCRTKNSDCLVVWICSSPFLHVANEPGHTTGLAVALESGKVISHLRFTDLLEVGWLHSSARQWKTPSQRPIMQATPLELSNHLVPSRCVQKL